MRILCMTLVVTVLGCGARTDLLPVPPAPEVADAAPDTRRDPPPDVAPETASDAAPEVAPDVGPDVAPPDPCAPGCAPNLTAGLVAYWKLDGSAIDSIAGTSLGGWPSGTPSYTAGKLGQGHAPGICATDYLCENSVALATDGGKPQLLFDDDFTISIWAKRTASYFADNTW